MDAENARWLGGIALAIISSLIGVIYWSMRSDNKRHAKNIHNLRNTVQAIIMTLATKGIRVPKEKNDD